MKAKPATPGAQTRSNSSTAKRRSKKNGASHDGATAPSNGEGMMPSFEDIAVRAHSIWMSEGCPTGREEVHWHRAEEELRGSVAA